MQVEKAQLIEENSVVKGRCTNLVRDAEMHYNEMHRLNNDQSSASH